MSQLRIVLADDHAIVRDGLRGLIDAQNDMEVVGAASNGEEAVRLASELKPDVLVMDVSMPGMTGIEAAKQLRQDKSKSRILALTMHEDRATLRQLLEAGASGYALKRAAGEELINAIRTVATEGMYLHPTMAAKMVGSYIGKRPSGDTPRPENDADILSEREIEVVRLLAQGYSNKEVGAKMDVSVKTVETYRARVAAKLGLQSRVELVRFALQQGWLQQDS